MSDHWIAIIPKDINSHVEADALQQVADLFSTIAPDAEEINIIHSNSVQLFDCGANLEHVKCPSCGVEMDIEWWRDRVEGGYNECDKTFELASIRLSCCGYVCTLNNLSYHFDQGFSRWGVEVMNPEIGELDGDSIKKIEGILGCPVKVVYQHI